MTPKERAITVAFSLGLQLVPQQIDAIAAAIRTAIADECEMCARVCDEQGKDETGNWHGNESYRAGANECAEIIRKRTE